MDLENVTNKGTGSFNTAIWNEVGRRMKSELQDMGLKLFNLHYGREERFTIENEDAKLHQTIFHKQVYTSDILDGDPHYLGFPHRLGTRFGHIVDSEQNNSYLYTVKIGEKDGDVILSRLKKGIDLQEIWAGDKSELNFDRNYAEARVGMKYEIRINPEAKPEEAEGFEGGLPSYDAEDITWRADIRPLGNAAEDRVLTKTYQILKESAANYQEETENRLTVASVE